MWLEVVSIIADAVIALSALKKSQKTEDELGEISSGLKSGKLKARVSEDELKAQSQKCDQLAKELAALQQRLDKETSVLRSMVK